jgi:hypothetical protein
MISPSIVVASRITASWTTQSVFCHDLYADGASEGIGQRSLSWFAMVGLRVSDLPAFCL